MKDLKNIIAEKLKLNKQSKYVDDKIISFANELEICPEDAEWLYTDYYDNESLRKEIFCDDMYKEYPINAFCALVMLADMLILDGNNASDVYLLGTTRYKYKNNNKHNPYDYAYWDGENPETEITLLEYAQYWIKHNFEKFEKVFNFLSSIKEKNKSSNILDPVWIEENLIFT